MPYASVNGTRLYYRIDGDRNSHAPWLVLAHALGSDVSLWSPQIDALARAFRVLRYDARGHGRSDAPRGPYTIDGLADDAAGLLDVLAIERAHFCGLSMGGMTALAFGARHAARASRLVVAMAAARNPLPQAAWNERAALVRREGTRGLVEATMERWLGPAFTAREPLVCAAVRDAIVHTEPEGYASCCEAIGAADLREGAAGLAMPTLVIGGAHDPSTAPEHTRELAASIPGARYAELDARHLSNVEQAGAFTAAVLEFLQES
jgi:3-oxoadipate enol-lactonase